MPRPPIPEDIKRQVRQLSGFGCILCGELVCDYEHIVPWPVCREHKVQNIVLLCTRHHREVTSGRTPKARVLEAQKTPFALKNGNNAFYSFEAAPQKAFHIGSNTFILGGFNPFHLVLVGCKHFASIEFEYGIPLLSLEVSGKKEGNFLKIVRNEVIVNSYRLWDVHLTGKKFMVKRKSGEILLKIVFDNGNIHIEKLMLEIPGYTFHFSKDGVLIDGGSMHQGVVRHCMIRVDQEYAFVRIGQRDTTRPVGAFIALDGPQTQQV